MKLSTLLLATVLAAPALAQQSAARVADPGFVIRTDAQEVVVDMIARDKKGNPIRDLQPNEIQLFEDGEVQEIVSFRKVTGGALERIGGKGVAPVSEGAGPQVPSRGVAASAPSMRLAQLVVMVFERLGNNSRNLAFRGARDFLRTELSDNVYVAVYVLDRKLHAIQPFTQDQELLQTAIETALGRNRSDFYTASEQVEQRLQEFLQKSNAPTQQMALAQNSLATQDGAPNIDAMLAQRAYEIAQRSEQMAQAAEATSSIFSLIALVRAFDDLVGRKTVLMFSEGFNVPANYESHLDGLVSEANRSQVSFYTIDARGLQTGGQLEQAKRLLNDAAANSRSQQEKGKSSEQRGYRQSEIQALDNAQSSIRANRQGTLQELAARTGGEFIGNTNSFAKPLARLTDDLYSYYEISYRPPLTEMDGSFREVSVEIGRPDVVLQTRDGYYAVPPASGDVLTMPFEMPMMAKLAEDPRPTDVRLEATWLAFLSPERKPLVSLAARVPLADLQFPTREIKDPAAKKKKGAMKTVYNARFSILAQLLDESGSVVKRASQDVPLEGDVERLEALRRASFRLYKTWEVLPGAYTLQAVVRDRANNDYGTFETGVLVEPAATGVAISSLALIERIDDRPKPGTTEDDKSKKHKRDREPEPRGEEIEPSVNPLEFRLGTVVPAAAQTISKSAGGNVSFYFVVYPTGAGAAKPTLNMEYFLDGQLVGKGAPDLPAPEPNGTIPYIATTPAAAFPPGKYTMRVEVTQGGESAEQRGYFTITE